MTLNIASSVRIAQASDDFLHTQVRAEGMPLTHLDDDYMIWRVFRRVTFWMADDKGFPVRCSMGNEVLEDHAKRHCVEGTDVGKIFEAHRPLIERVASDAYDAGVVDEEGRVPVTMDALERASRSA